MAKKAKASQKRQSRAIRSDAKVGKAERVIEDHFALPKGSVKILLPSGKDARSDKSIGNLLKDWD